MIEVRKAVAHLMEPCTAESVVAKSSSPRMERTFGCALSICPRRWFDKADYRRSIFGDSPFEEPSRWLVTFASTHTVTLACSTCVRAPRKGSDSPASLKYTLARCEFSWPADNAFSTWLWSERRKRITKSCLRGEAVCQGILALALPHKPTCFLAHAELRNTILDTSGLLKQSNFAV